MAEHDISLVTSKAGSVIAENLKVSIATPAGALTPATLTAMVGIAQGTALQLSPTVTKLMSDIDTKISQLTALGPGDAATAAAALTAAKANLLAQTQAIMPTGNHAAFGTLIGQVESHIADGVEVINAASFMQSSKFEDFGSGIKDMASMATRGLDTALGSLPKVADAMKSAGPIFNMEDMKNFGTGVGLVKNLSDNMLSNATGVSQALAKAGVNLSDIENPLYKDTVDQVLGTITDPKTITTVLDQFGAAAPKVGVGGIQSLKDLTDIKKIAPSLSGVTTDLAGIGSKLSNMGASFTDAGKAEEMFKNIAAPVIPTLNSSAKTLSGAISGLKSGIENMTGTGSGPLGMPSMQDFMETVCGGPKINSMISSFSTTTGNAALQSLAGTVETFVTDTASLLSKAGINLDDPPAPPSLSGALSFATNLHKFGADISGSGVSNMLSSMSVPGTAAGDAIKASLIEGKNKLAMSAAGIPPINFNPNMPDLSKLPSAGVPSSGATFLTGG